MTGIESKRRISRFSMFTLSSALMCMAIINLGCEGEKKADPEIDVFTSATPGVATAQLSDSHSGWKDPVCMNCHETTLHTEGFKVSHCATCHGSNGAPKRPKEHNRDSGCISCHENSHKENGLVEDNDCRSCHIFNGNGNCSYTEDYDVVVIGAGGGGLSAAAFLSQAGKKVLVIEQHYTVGGSMGRFNRGDYKFEESLHAFDGMGLMTLEELGIKDRVEPLTSDIMYRSIFPDFEIDVPADVTAYHALLKELFPDETEGIDALFDTFTSFGFNKVTSMSLLEAIASHGIKDEKLATVIAQLSVYLAAVPDELPASLFIGMWGSFHTTGYNYFTGGSQAIIDALTQVVQENAGIIKTNTLATEIVVNGEKVTQVKTREGGCYNASYVISNASPQATYLKLIGEEKLPSDLVKKVNSLAAAPSEISMVYLGVDYDYTEYFPANTHQIWYNVDYATNQQAFLSTACQPEKTAFFITNYSTLDTTAAPPGKNAMVITAFFMGYACNDEWNFYRSYQSYTDYKKEIADIYISRAEQLLPDLSKHIELVEVATPHTIEQYTLNPRGSWAGRDVARLDPSQNGFLASEEQMTPFENLFLTGAWVSGCSQSVALRSGVAAAKLVLNNEP